MGEVTYGGRRTAYHEAGAAREGCPVLCVHGFVGGKEDFAEALTRLGRQRRAVAIDLPGHGGSAANAKTGGYTLDALSRSVLDACDALGLVRAHLVGHSLGGLVAQRVAASNPGRVASLVLVGTGRAAPSAQGLAEIRRIADAVAEGGTPAGFAAACAIAERNGPMSSDQRSRQRRRFAALCMDGVLGEAQALASARAVAVPSEIPVLVVHGEDEHVWPAALQAELVAATGAGYRAVVGASGHSPQSENPDGWLAAVGPFLDRCEQLGP